VYTITLYDPTSTTLAVMPPVVPLPHFHVLSSGWTGEGRPNRHMLQETINTSHTREMQPRDPLRLIHWKTTARQGKFFVRQFEGSPMGDWWIVLDLDHGVQLGEGWDSTEEHGVILAASLAAQGLHADHPVGLSVNGTNAEWIPPRRNEYQLRSVLKSLAVAAPVQMPLKDYLQRVGPSLSSHCSLLIVTANPDVEWAQSLLPLMWRGIMPTTFLLEPVSFGGSADTRPLSGTLQSMGLACHIIPRDFLDTSQARPGREGEWEWRVSATGKAIAVRAAQGEWRELG
jgi:uncharacterized protein (DUF58 family)